MQETVRRAIAVELWFWQNHLDLMEASVLQSADLLRSDGTAMPDKDDILLNSKQVAFLLDLSPDTVNELARHGILPAFKKGRQWRFRKRDIASFKRQARSVNAAA